MSDRAPFLTLRGLPAVLGFGVLLCWPLLFTGHLHAFADSNSYLSGGDAIWTILAQSIPSFNDPQAPIGDAVLSAEAEQGTASIYGRSITYAAFLTAVIRTAGPFAMTFVQASLISFAVFSMIDRSALERPVLLGIGLLLCALLTPLAWMSSYLMPDVFGALVLLFAALLVKRLDALTAKQRWAVVLLGCFAVSTHYGNIPLAFALIGLVLVYRLLKGRLSAPAVWAGVLVMAFAPIVNLAASALVLGDLSLAPLRPPVVLARSLEDGPARWYLEEQCADNSEDYCAAFDPETQTNHHDFLWGAGAIGEQDAEAAQNMRERELEIVLAAAREYPLEQLASFFRNGFQQFILISHTGQPFNWTGEFFTNDGVPGLYGTRSSVETVMTAAIAVSALVLLGLVLTGRLTRTQQEMLAVIVAGLLINAFIFGGLSAPAERYQARLTWILPFYLVLFAAETGFAKRRPA